MIKKALSLAVAGTLLAAGCGKVDDKGASGGSTSSRTLVVFAAASLTGTFNSLGETFEAAHPGVRVKFSFGGSSTLAQQITQGAPADVFAAANEKTMQQVGGAAVSPATFVKNRLEIAVPPGNPGRVAALRDLTSPKLKVVLCAKEVPCGSAARQALTASGLKLTPVSEEQDVKAALTKVELKEADAALVYRTDVRAAAGKVTGVDFPEAAKAINTYPIATLAKAPQAALAKQFVQLVLSPRGSAVLTRAGFERP